MNPAIVAPDAFDIVSLGVDKGLTPDQVQHTQLNIINLIKSLEINHLLRYSAEFKICHGYMGSPAVATVHELRTYEEIIAVCSLCHSKSVSRF